jgi:integrase
MARRRNAENKGLPARWRSYHGAYYYQVPPGLEHIWGNKKQFRLGTSLPEAYKVWAERVGSPDKARNVNQLLDRYALEVVPKKAPTTQVGNAHQIAKLRPIFGNMALGDIKPQHVYQYVDKRGKKVAAHREIAVLSHALTKAVEWGYIDRHPFKKEVRLEGEPPRTRYVTDEEIIAALALPTLWKRGSVRSVCAYIRLKLLTGLRRGDLLRLRITSLREDGIAVVTNKTGKPVVYEWTDALRAAVEEAKAARRVDISPFLFCNKRGEGYIDERTGTASGWDSMWQRFMDRLIDEKKITERFTEHDLRAKVGSDAESLERASKLLAHADQKITQRVYRRKPEVLKPTS